MATDIVPAVPETMPITVDQYRVLVDQGAFDNQPGQIELIYGRIVRMNPQGPTHSDPIDELTEWSFEQAAGGFRVRVEKPIEIPDLNSSPEPDIAWVTRRRYSDRHPKPEDIHLLIEVSGRSKAFDRGEKLRLYAEAKIAEYWIVDVVDRTIEVFTSASGSAFEQSVTFGLGDTIHPRCLATAKLSVDRLFRDTVQ